MNTFLLDLIKPLKLFFSMYFKVLEVGTNCQNRIKNIYSKVVKYLVVNPTYCASLYYIFHYVQNISCYYSHILSSEESEHQLITIFRHCWAKFSVHQSILFGSLQQANSLILFMIDKLRHFNHLSILYLISKHRTSSNMHREAHQVMHSIPRV